MPVYTSTQVAHYWELAFGDSTKVGIALAIARAESGFNSDAASASDDWGLWQINAVNFPALGINRVTARDPLINAQAAVRLSKNGQNWGDWCTAYANPARDCGHIALALPQVGSAAYPFLATYGVLATAPGAGDWQSAANEAQDSLESAWGAVQNFHGAYANTRFGSFHALANALKGLQQ